ncbi:hypothetical protein U1Q18_034816 [Sarracenia purpurea var. burkii]
MQGRPGLMLGAIYRTHVALAVVVDAEVMAYSYCVVWWRIAKYGLVFRPREGVGLLCRVRSEVGVGLLLGLKGEATKGGSSAQPGTNSEGVWRSISLPNRLLTVQGSSFEVGLGSYLEFVSMPNLHLAILANGFNEDGGWYLGWTESDV